MTNHHPQLLQLLELLRRELSAVTLDTQQASELARLIDAIEVQIPGHDGSDTSAGSDFGNDSDVKRETPQSTQKALKESTKDVHQESYLETASGIQQHLIDDLNREATSLETDHPDTVATVRTLINMLSNLGI